VFWLCPKSHGFALAETNVSLCLFLSIKKTLALAMTFRAKLGQSQKRFEPVFN
jgi:hypothetical protein